MSTNENDAIVFSCTSNTSTNSIKKGFLKLTCYPESALLYNPMTESFQGKNKNIAYFYFWDDKCSIQIKKKLGP